MKIDRDHKTHKTYTHTHSLSPSHALLNSHKHTHTFRDMCSVYILQCLNMSTKTPPAASERGQIAADVHIPPDVWPNICPFLWSPLLHRATPSLTLSPSNCSSADICFLFERGLFCFRKFWFWKLSYSPAPLGGSGDPKSGNKMDKKIHAETKNQRSMSPVSRVSVSSRCSLHLQGEQMQPCGGRDCSTCRCFPAKGATVNLTALTP